MRSARCGGAPQAQGGREPPSDNSDLARSLLADIEARRDGLRAALSTAEGELAGKEAEPLDLELVTQAIQAFDSAFEHLTAAEKREFLQLLIHRATVHPDRVDVELYNGRYASRYIQQATRNGVRIGPRVGEAEDDNEREPVERFAAGEEGLPVAAQGDRQTEVLRSWEVSKELPPHPGFGHRRHRPSDEGVKRQQKRNLERNLAAAGQVES